MRRDTFWAVIGRETEVVVCRFSVSVTCLYYLRKNGAAARRGGGRREGGRLEQREVGGRVCSQERPSRRGRRAGRRCIEVW